VEGVKENGAPPPELAPLRFIATTMSAHPEVGPGRYCSIHAFTYLTRS
jgi:hypothetical protein